ncbi:cytochrome PufQ [Aestuariibius sp. 2305UL40-4]|uniref:cytochrome PufQ n=1 Tax=Aestuariibius violaceus TaxID=3234132 RepID=UPI00345E57C0
MTDMTSDLAPAEPKVRHAPPKREYYAYFGVIFAATLPLACVTWVLKAGRQMSLPDKDPISAAWSQARIITPMIFSA